MFKNHQGFSRHLPVKRLKFRLKSVIYVKHSKMCCKLCLFVMVSDLLGEHQIHIIVLGLLPCKVCTRENSSFSAAYLFDNNGLHFYLLHHLLFEIFLHNMATSPHSINQHCGICHLSLLVPSSTWILVFANLEKMRKWMLFEQKINIMTRFQLIHD